MVLLRRVSPQLRDMRIKKGVHLGVQKLAGPRWRNCPELLMEFWVLFPLRLCNHLGH